MIPPRSLRLCGERGYFQGLVAVMSLGPSDTVAQAKAAASRAVVELSRVKRERGAVVIGQGERR